MIDIWLFGLMRAGRGSPFLMRPARWVARWSWVPLLGVVLLTSLSHAFGLWLALVCLSYAGLVQFFGKRLARRWQAQRPFVLGLSENHLGHSTRAGFPSSHALVMGAVVGVLLPFTFCTAILAVKAGIAVSTGWARVHTGAHFPLDVLAGLSLGMLSGLPVSLLLSA